MIVVCTYKRHNENFIFECINHLNIWNKDEPVVIVDNNSPDKSYFDKVKNMHPRVTILSNSSNNREVGAWWHAYNYASEREYYCFIHDSFMLKTNIRKFIPPKRERSVHAFAKFKNWHGSKPDDWANNFFKQSKIFKNLDKFWSIYGIMFVCRNHIMKKLKKNNVHKLMPSTRSQAMITERMYGIFFKELEIQVKSSVKGSMPNEHDYGIFKKYRPGR